MDSEPKASSSSRVWARSLNALKRFLASESGRPAIAWFLLLTTLLLSVNGLNVVNSYVGRDFMTSIAEHQHHAYVTYALRYLAVFAASTVVAVLARFSEERLRLLWRGWLTQALIIQYLTNHVYHRIVAREEVDNPDQRITDDVKSYTQSTLSFLLLSLNATITSVAFLGVLWSITPWLVVVAFAYSALGTGAAVLLGRPLVRLDNLQLKKEADLRYHLIQVREQSEAIATTRIERAVRSRLIGRLEAVVENTRLIIAVSRNLGFFTNGYNYLIQIIPLLIVAPLYMAGHVEFGVVTQSVMAFAQVLGAFSLIVTQFETLSSLAAVAERLNAVAEAIDQARDHLKDPKIRLIPEGDRLAFEGLTLREPKGGRTLLDALNAEVPPGGSLLVAGTDTTATTALFLAIAGVWSDGEGTIHCPGGDATQFVPRRPYRVRGTLRELITQALPGRSFSDETVLGALGRVGLGPALERLGGLDTEQDWASALAPDEQQLLAFARVLLATPRFAVIDRAAEPLRPAQVDLIFGLLAETSIGRLTLGDKAELAPYHDALLEILEEGRWRFSPLEKPTRPEAEPAAP